MINCKSGRIKDVLARCRGSASQHCYVLTEYELFDFLYDLRIDYGGKKFQSLTEKDLLRLIEKKFAVEPKPDL